MPDEHWLNQHVSPSRLDLEMSGQMCWENLVAWLQRYHQDTVIGYADLANPDCHAVVIARAFALVRELLDLPWTRVRLVLKHFKEAAEANGSNGMIFKWK